MLGSTTVKIAILLLSLILIVTCKKTPNIIVFLADDFGYGDLPITGHPTIEAPHITRMAREGLFLQQWYAGECVCTPSRAALVTGQYAARNGFYSNFSYPLSSQIRVLLPLTSDGLGRIPTLPKALKKNAGYATALIGKWHLGHLNNSLPTQNGGFDYFWGIPFAGNFGCDLWQNTSNSPNYLNTIGCRVGWAGMPLMKGTEVIEQPMHQPSFESRLVKESINFLKKNKNKPSFILHAFHHTHIPLNPGPEWKGKTLRGKYGDAVAEIDGSLGEVLDYVRKNENGRCTVAFFTSDNGPWLRERLDGGSAALFRSGKGSTYEGGTRVPGIIWSNCPEYKAGLNGGINQRAFAGTLDIFPTAMELAGIPKKVWEKYNLDGFSLVPIMKGSTQKTPRQFIPYFRGPLMMAARYGKLKAHYITQDDEGEQPPVTQNPPIYYDLYEDPSEKYPLAADKIDQNLLANLNQAVADLKAQLTPMKVALLDKLTNNSLVCCRSDPSAPPCVCGGKKAIAANPPADVYTPIIPPLQRDYAVDIPVFTGF